MRLDEVFGGDNSRETGPARAKCPNCHHLVNAERDRCPECKGRFCRWCDGEGTEPRDEPVSWTVDRLLRLMRETADRTTVSEEVGDALVEARRRVSAAAEATREEATADA